MRSNKGTDHSCTVEFGQAEAVGMREDRKGRRQQLGDTGECGAQVRGMTEDKEQKEQDKGIQRQRRTSLSDQPH